MDFYSAYGRVSCGWRLVRCTPRSPSRRLTRNRYCAIAQDCHDDHVGVAVYPELTLSGYSLEDIVMQDTLLDSVESALDEVIAGSADLLPVLIVGAPLRFRHRIYNTAAVIHRGRLLGVVPKSYLPTYREFYERRQIAPGADERGTIPIGGARRAIWSRSVVRRYRPAGFRIAR